MRHDVGDEQEHSHDGETDGDVPLAPAREGHPPLEGPDDDLETEDELDVRHDEDRWRKARVSRFLGLGPEPLCGNSIF